MKSLSVIRLLQRPFYRNAFLVVLFIPILFIDNRSSHDWGDDFAQYIHQAGNMVQGVPQSETGFVYSQENYIGPAAYPAGFPLLLAPVYAIFGNQMKVFTTYISFFYFLLAFLILFFYRNYFSPAAALVLTIILVYNPQLLLFKQEVMSDLPFTAFLVLSFLVYPHIRPGHYRNLILFGLLAGFIMMIRSVGFVLLAAIAADQLRNIFRQRKFSRKNHETSPPLAKLLVFPSILVSLPIVFYFLLNSVIFRIPSGGSLRDYLYFYYSGNFLGTIPANLEHYVEVFRYMYTPALGIFSSVALVTGSVFLAMTVFGFIRKASTHLEVVDLFFIFYIFILLVFPNNYSAYRLLVPVGFILLYYAALGFKSIRVPYVASGKKRIMVLGVIMISMFIPGILQVAASRNTMLDGPQQKESRQAFSYILKNLPDSAAIVFLKPRALALYTGKKGFADPFSQDPTVIHVQLVKINADYILIHNQLTAESMKRYTRVMKSRVSEVWKNKQFRLLKINPPNPEELY